jgi:hypothetical protein
MSRQKEKFIVLDVETANDIPDTLTYNVGFVVADRSGEIFHQHDFVISDIFTEEKELMQSCYYANKLPLYEQRIENKKIKVVSIFTVRRLIAKYITQYNIKKVYAYNASFDRSALNITQRYLTKSKYRWFFPYGVEICCIWHMACQTICNRMDYCFFCLKNGYYSKNGNMTTNAETVYKYMTKDNEFEEEHTGLSDSLIELKILCKCLSYHEKIDRHINRGCYHIPQKKFKKIQKKVLTNQ